MKKELNKILVLFVLIFVGNFTNVKAQQDSQYTQYMYNTMTFNPAYAGTREVFSAIALYRNQWTGLDGAPVNMNLAMHTPLGEKVGLGLSIANNQIFVSTETAIDFSFSYIMNVSYEGKLSLGIKAGMSLFDVDFSKLNTGSPDGSDPSLQYNVDNEFSPQIGAGAYYYTDRFYVGLSVPNLLETEHFDQSSVSIAGERLHFYAMAGYVFDLSEDVMFKPSALIKAVSGSPLQVDVSTNFLFYEQFTIGVAYRWGASASGLLGFQIDERFMIGYSYDWETTPLAQYSGGSHEVFLRFELFNRRGRYSSRRFF